MSQVLTAEAPSARSEEAAPAAARAPAATPGLAPVLTSLASLALLGAAAGVGSGDVAVALRAVPSAALVGTGAALLTGPALVVAHQFLALEARPDALVGAMARGYVRLGRLARGLAPFVLFFSATSSLWAAAFCVVFAGIGVGAVALAWDELVAAERAASPQNRLGREFQMALLALGWGVLTALVALRLGWNVAGFVAGI